MDGQRQISVYQFTLLTILYTLGSTLLVISSSLAEELQQDAWLGAALGTAAGIALVAVYVALSDRFPDMTVTELTGHLLGKTAGRLFMLLFLTFNFYSTAALTWYVGNFLTTNLFVETPPVVLNIIFVATILYGAYLGIGTLARSAESSFVTFSLVFLVFFITLIPEAKPGNLLPFMETAPSSIFRATFTFASFAFFPYVSLLMVYPKHVINPKSCGKALYVAVLASGIILTLVVLLTIMVLSGERTSIEVYPTYNLSKRINIGHFFERIEALLILLWILSLYYQVVLSYFASITVMAELFQMKEYRSLNLPMGLFIVMFSQIVYPNIGYQQNFDYRVWPVYSATFAFWPVVLLLVAVVRGRRTGSL